MHDHAAKLCLNMTRSKTQAVGSKGARKVRVGHDCRGVKDTLRLQRTSKTLLDQRPLKHSKKYLYHIPP